MDVDQWTLEVFFEGPFWVGVFSRTREGALQVCKVTFGAEPKDAALYAFVLKQYTRLPFSPAVEAERQVAHANPKRRQRQAKSAVQDLHLGTKAQQALQLQREQLGSRRRETTRARREEVRQQRFQQAQQKRKEKHRGH